MANDYAKRLHIGQVECQDLIQDVIGGYVSEKSGIKPPKFEFCEKLNISVCNLTETSSNVSYHHTHRCLDKMLKLTVSEYIMCESKNCAPMTMTSC